MTTDYIEPWWHPYPARWDDEDDSRTFCPHCEGRTCYHCRWTGIVPVDAPEVSDEAR